MTSWNEILLEVESYMERYRKALKDIADSSEQANPIKLKEIARTALDGEPTTADELNDDEDAQLGASIVKSNDNVAGVFMVDGKIKDVDYVDEEVFDVTVKEDYGPPYSMANTSGEPVKAHPLGAGFAHKDTKKGIQDDTEC